MGRKKMVRQPKLNIRGELKSLDDFMKNRIGFEDGYGFKLPNILRFFKKGK